jgi:type I restriction enzyme, S subunit
VHGKEILEKYRQPIDFKFGPRNWLIAVRPHAATSQYLYFVFLNAVLSRAFVDETKGVNMHHIDRVGLAQFVVPLPPGEEQQKIVRRLKRPQAN